MKRSYHGVTRRGEGRTENHDAFHIDDDLGLFVVFDGVQSTALTAAVLDVLTGTVAELLRGPHADVALHGAALTAHEKLRELGAAAEIAALLFVDQGAQMLASGNCRVYRARNAVVEVMTAMARSSGQCLGSASGKLLVRNLLVDGGDTFVLSTDGCHRTGDDRDPRVERPDALGFHVRAPLEGLTATLMSTAEEDDDATILAVRVARADPRVDLERIVDEELDAFCERTGDHGTFLVSVSMQFATNPPGIAEEYPRLSLLLKCDPALGPEGAAATAAAFARALEWRQPRLGGPHEWKVDTGTPSIRERTQAIREIAENIVARHRGIYVGPIEALPDTGLLETISVLIVRDDVIDAEREYTVANEVRVALDQAAPELVGHVVVRGDYCK